MDKIVVQSYYERNRDKIKKNNYMRYYCCTEEEYDDRKIYKSSAVLDEDMKSKLKDMFMDGQTLNEMARSSNISHYLVSSFLRKNGLYGQIKIKDLNDEAIVIIKEYEKTHKKTVTCKKFNISVYTLNKLIS